MEFCFICKKLHPRWRLQTLLTSLSPAFAFALWMNKHKCRCRCGMSGLALRATSHEIESPWPLLFKHNHWWKRWSRSKFASHYAWGTNGVYMWMQDECKAYMDSYMTSNASCFMVTLINFKNHVLEIGLTQNRETMTLRKWSWVGLNMGMGMTVWAPNVGLYSCVKWPLAKPSQNK